MPTPPPILLRARKQPAKPGRLRLFALALAGAAAAALAGCSPVVSIENADVPGWRATALPTAPGTLIEDAGKILNRDRIVQEARDVPAGRYTLTATCEGGGKAFFAVSLDGEAVVDAGAACNGSREITRIALPRSGTLEISTSSVDAPLIYAYQLTPAE
ncbi:hypothetical protein AAIH32_11295 [Pseudarthrobacter oxydans]|uniref:hypothetical protein n=1 Tax=Pseudarthrobacter oxydans TaxID=1671 RepID=UPI003D2A285E